MGFVSYTKEEIARIEADRRREWEESFVWRGECSYVRLVRGGYLPHVVSVFWGSGNDGKLQYVPLDYVRRSAKTLEQAIEWALQAEGEIDWNAKTAKDAWEDGSFARAWRNIEEQWT